MANIIREREGIFVIRYKNYNGYKPYKTSYGIPSLDVNNAELFETRTKAYKRMLELKIDKECVVEEIKNEKI